MFSVFKKQFKLKPEDIKNLVPDIGGCYATNVITMDGLKVEFMYREETDEEGFRDSGWRFFSGKETQEYVDNPENTQIYDVNTIANYDQDILSFLNAPCGSMFERDEKGEFIEVFDK